MVTTAPAGTEPDRVSVTVFPLTATVNTVPVLWSPLYVQGKRPPIGLFAAAVLSALSKVMTNVEPFTVALVTCALGSGVSLVTGFLKMVGAALPAVSSR